MTSFASRSDVLRLQDYDTPTLANAITSVVSRRSDTGFTRPPLRWISAGSGRMVGAAVTATIRSEYAAVSRQERLTGISRLHEAIAATPGPTVVVVSDLDQGPGCLWGEVNATIAQTLGAVGVVTDGLVRDIPDCDALGFHFVARGLGVSHAYVRVVSIGERVDVGGAEVQPGDVVHADVHGALVLPAEAVPDLPAAADAAVHAERELLEWVRSPQFDVSQLMAQRLRH